MLKHMIPSEGKDPSEDKDPSEGKDPQKATREMKPLKLIGRVCCELVQTGGEGGSGNQSNKNMYSTKLELRL